MGMFDYFVGSLKCSTCRNISKTDSSTNMQTKIRSKPQLDEIGVGHPLQVSQSLAEGAGYLTVQQPKLGEVTRLLDIWTCPFCGTPYNWAEIIIQNGVIKDVLAVAKKRESIEQAHFVSDECLLGLAAELGLDYNHIDRHALIQRVLQFL
ncbi:MAG: hypothetical protein HC780_13490 [Leptolyngbyaceae cyanobacterium CSU_1_3]|nr:hypothetical protein [Leptolyngbyaceae cyanobacterium CSU_1_3]